MMRSWGRWVLLGAMVMGGSALAQGRPGASQQIPEQQSQPHSNKRDPMADQAAMLSRTMVADGVPAFLSQLQRVNETEITLGELTHQKGSTPAVQQYGEHMVQDHQKAMKQIADFAKQHNIALDPMAGPTNDVQRRLNGLTEATKSVLPLMQGPLYDQQYLASQVAEHDRNIQIVTLGRQLYPDLAPVLDGLLPVLREHRDHAYQLLGQSQPRAEAGPQPQPAQQQAQTPEQQPQQQRQARPAPAKSR
jgi:putative membrane protein